MLIQGLPDAVIRFVTDERVFNALDSQESMTCTALAQKYGCTPQAASKYLKTLVVSGYVVRQNYRSWALNRSHLQAYLSYKEEIHA